MKRVVAQKIDSLADYSIVEAERPVAAVGQVLIEVHACSMGYVDALIATGGYQVKPPVPFTPGQDIAGVVVELGGGVDGLVVGDRVMASLFGGGLSEFVTANAGVVKKLPDAVTFEQGAVLGVNYLTALTGLKDRADIQPREKLLVFGSAGGVGCAAVQVGRLLGAEVIAVASTEEKRAFAIANGAHAALDTNAEGWRERLKEICGGTGPDVIFDPVCGPLFEAAFRSLAWRGRHLVVGFVGGPIPKLPINLSLMKGASLIGVDVRQFRIFEQEHANELSAELLEWAGSGRLKPVVGKIFPFEHFAEAMQFATTGAGMAKAVIRVHPG